MIYPNQMQMNAAAPGINATQLERMTRYGNKFCSFRYSITVIAFIRTDIYFRIISSHSLLLFCSVAVQYHLS